MYLDESIVIYLLLEGWPFDVEALRDLGKLDEVIILLRHLLYMREGPDAAYADAAPQCRFADWQDLAQCLMRGHISAKDIRLISEGSDHYKIIPPYVVSLICGGCDNCVFLLDTKRGTVVWYECPQEVWQNSSWEGVLGFPSGYYEDTDEDEDQDKVEDEKEENDEDSDGEQPDNEEWLGCSKAWVVADFFNLLQNLFRDPKFVPTDSLNVRDVFTIYPPSFDGVLPMIQEIHCQHGWPDL